MKTLPKIVESTATIRFQDCDPFNHLNNAAYLNYMINAREDQIKQHYGLDIFDMIKTQGLGWVVGTNQIAYLKPALLMEQVVIQSQLLWYQENQLGVEIRMYNHDKTEVKAVLWSTFVHFNIQQQKRWKHQDSLVTLFEAVVLPTTTHRFEERIQQLRPQKV